MKLWNLIRQNVIFYLKYLQKTFAGAPYYQKMNWATGVFFKFANWGIKEQVNFIRSELLIWWNPQKAMKSYQAGDNDIHNGRWRMVKAYQGNL